MNTVVSDMAVQQVGRERKIGFYAAAGLFVALFVVLYGIVIGVLHYPIMGWFNPEALTIHQFHETISGLLIYVVIIGMLAQVYRPRKQIGAMQQAFFLMTIVVGTMVVGGTFQPPVLIFLVLALTAAGLHPAREQLLKVRHVDAYLLALVAVAALPLLSYGVEHMTLQRAVKDAHAATGHYGIMGAYAFAIVALGLLASFRPDGWRIPTYSVSALIVFLV